MARSAHFRSRPINDLTRPGFNEIDGATCLPHPHTRIDTHTEKERRRREDSLGIGKDAGHGETQDVRCTRARCGSFLSHCWRWSVFLLSLPVSFLLHFDAISYFVFSHSVSWSATRLPRFELCFFILQILSVLLSIFESELMDLELRVNLLYIFDLC